MENIKEILAVLIALFEIVGVITALRAIMEVRSSQGAIAWAICLITFPYIAVPFYWIFGRNKFEGYVETLRARRFEKNKEIQDIVEYIQNHKSDCCDKSDGQYSLLSSLSVLPFTKNNDVHLLINGEETYETIFSHIEHAKKYILLQYYSVSDDETGRRLKSLLIKKAAEKVRIYFLYDEIGSYDLPNNYIDDLLQSDVDIQGFKATRGRSNHFQINFRNHRKIVIVDGEVGFMGGLNIGNDYLGKHDRLHFWRDTHLKITGPAVLAMQLSFFADWFWANREVPEVEWVPRPVDEADKKVLILPTSPADDIETCEFFITHLLNSAQKRIWITTPYFVPDEAIMNALKLAAMRGVDVRIILPLKNDMRFAHLAAFSYLAESYNSSIKFYWYQKGFMHQKVILIDDNAASVGTINLDNRSLKLNFEITAFVLDREFASQVEAMLIKDFEDCRPARQTDYEARGFIFKVFVRVARLLSPLL